MNVPSSLLANPTLPGAAQQLEKLQNGIAQAQGANGETRLKELRKATQEFEAVFIGVAKGYLLFFRFFARTEQEMNQLAQTMNSLEFEK